MMGNQKHQNISNVVLPNLPAEIWCFIFSYLPTESKKKATAICKLWFEIIRSDPKLSGHISVSLNGIQNENWTWENWPSLKTLEISDSDMSLTSSKTAMDSMKKLNFRNCPNLDKVILCAKFDWVQLSTVTTNFKITEGILTVCQLVFNPKVDINLFNIEHLKKVMIHLRAYSKFTDEYGSESLKKIGEAAQNLDCISVWDKFDGPEFEERLFIPTKENDYMGCFY